MRSRVKVEKLRTVDPQYRDYGPDYPCGRPAIITRLIITSLWFFLLSPFFASSIALPQFSEQKGALAEAKRLSQEAISLYRQGKFSEAEPLFRQALAVREKALGPGHPRVALSLNNLAVLYKAQGRYAEAERLTQRSLAIWEKTLGVNHPKVATSLNNLAELYRVQGRYAEAEHLYRRSLVIRESVLGPEHPHVALSLNNLAVLYKAQGRYAEAERLTQRSLEIREKVLGNDHPDVALSLNNLAELYHTQGRYAESEPLYRRSLAIWEKTLGPEHPYVATSLNNLAALYAAQARYAEADPFYWRSFTILEKALGPDHPRVAASLNNLAVHYSNQGKYAEAEQLYRRSLVIRERVLGPEHPHVALSLNNLAVIYDIQGKYAEAEPFYRRALTIREKALGRNHPDVAMSLNNLAELYRTQGRYAEAGPLYRRSLAIRERVLGPEHPDVAQSLSNLGLLYSSRGEYAEAEPLHRRSLAIYERALGPEHPAVATSVINLAFTLAGKQELALARRLYERARRIQLAIGRVNADLGDEALRGLFHKGNLGLRLYAELLAAIARDPMNDRSPSPAKLDAFVVVEQARGGIAQAALVKAAARAVAGEAATIHLARQVQDLRNRRQALNKHLTSEYSKLTVRRKAERLKALQEEARQLDRDLTDSVNRLNRAFPKYAELAAPEPIDVAGVQRKLRPDEGLVSYFTLDNRLLIWLMRPGKKLIYRDIEIKKADLAKMVARVRLSIDQSQNPDVKVGQLEPFDVAGAHTLYELLLEPLKDHLVGMRHLIVVPDEVLLPLPLGVLVTKAEGQPYKSLAALYIQKLHPAPKELADYAKLAWLAKEYAITVLPSATSLRALRQTARVKRARTEPFIGFGDPVLSGGGRRRGGAMLASRGVAVSVNDLRKLDRLPATRRELLAVARALGADPSRALYLGAKATEPVVLRLNSSGRLAKARVISFATHGLIAGQVTGLKQPALVLTPPKIPSEQDDGLLDLKDILGLKLDSADWVVLSACNTAAADGSGEGLSGLVRAFFFAGVRSLLVSHWSVDDSATQALMTEVFRRYTRDKTVPRSEALRQGMLAVMAKAEGETVYFAHPFAWAPFFLVGEGSTARN